MIESFGFLKLVVDAVADHMAVLDPDGNIVFNNRAWDVFAEENGSSVKKWAGVNYLAECERAARSGDEYGVVALAGIRDVILGTPQFTYEYPCHSPDALRWFLMNVSRFRYENELFILVFHINITQRKIAEDYALALSRKDALTGLYNRRHFDEFYQEEWKRCSRLQLPITVVMLDIDFFKKLNDFYGHQEGDECLRKVADVLKNHAKRPGDIVARYGGEEFVLVFGNSRAKDVLPLLKRMKDDIKNLRIPNKNSTISNFVTVSVGVAMGHPSRDSDRESLLREADGRLYDAKEKGRNRIEYKAGDQK